MDAAWAAAQGRQKGLAVVLFHANAMVDAMVPRAWQGTYASADRLDWTCSSMPTGIAIMELM